MNRSSFAIWMPVLVVFLMLLILSVDDVYNVVRNSFERYYWFLGGGLCIVIIDRLTKNSNAIFKVMHHELTHFFANILMFRKIQTMKVATDGGCVSSVGNKFLIEVSNLAPYCLPLAAYATMLMGYFFANDMLPVYSTLLGMAYTFHLLCIKSDFASWRLFGSHQPDINQYPLAFSYLYILCFWMFNTMIVLLSVRRDLIEAYIFMFDNFKQTISTIF